MFSKPIPYSADFKKGDIVNGWLITDTNPLGKGGFGKVFKVEKEVSGRRLLGALKIFSVDENANPSAGEETWRFEQEIELLDAAGGEFAPELYDRGEYAGVPYFVMERLKPVKPDKMPKTDIGITRMILDLLAAVEKLHGLKLPGSKAEGWVHCDIKPKNIARRKNGHYVLIDFGAAHEMDPEGADKHVPSCDSKNYRRGKYEVSGTSYYKPPECCFRPCRDIYALGHLLRDCFEEEVPFEWSVIVNKCISWKPEFRYADAAQMRDDVLNLKKLKRRVYGKLRKQKIKEQRVIERSLSKLRHKKEIVDKDTILKFNNELSSKNFTVFNIDLNRYDEPHNYLIKEPIRLKENSVVLIDGPGCLEADISGPSSSIIVVRAYAVFTNVNPNFPPINDLLYAVVGPGGYLNLKNIKEKDRPKFFPIKGKRRIFRDLDATTAFLFSGPETFAGIEKLTLDGIRKSDLPQGYRDLLVAFFKGDRFSVEPQKK